MQNLTSTPTSNPNVAGLISRALINVYKMCPLALQGWGMQDWFHFLAQHLQICKRPRPGCLCAANQSPCIRRVPTLSNSSRHESARPSPAGNQNEAIACTHLILLPARRRTPAAGGHRRKAGPRDAISSFSFSFLTAFADQGKRWKSERGAIKAALN